MQHAGRDARIDAADGDAWIVHELFRMLDEVAEEYEVSWHRAPYLRELVHYLALHFVDDEDSPAVVSDAPWNVGEAKFAFRSERKRRDRAEPPDVASVHSSARARVRHAKFGEGEVISEQGDRLTVQFGGEKRVVLRSFVVFL